MTVKVAATVGVLVLFGVLIHAGQSSIVRTTGGYALTPVTQTPAPARTASPLVARRWAVPKAAKGKPAAASKMKMRMRMRLHARWWRYLRRIHRLTRRWSRGRFFSGGWGR